MIGIALGTLSFGLLSDYVIRMMIGSITIPFAVKVFAYVGLGQFSLAQHGIGVLGAARRLDGTLVTIQGESSVVLPYCADLSFPDRNSTYLPGNQQRIVAERSIFYPSLIQQPINGFQ